MNLAGAGLLLFICYLGSAGVFLAASLGELVANRQVTVRTIFSCMVCATFWPVAIILLSLTGRPLLGTGSDRRLR